MTPASRARARFGAGAPDPLPDAAGALDAYLQRVDDRLQERAVVLAHVHRVDAQELFTLVRADLWARSEEFAASDEDERWTVTSLLLARHARMAARRAEGRSVPPVDHAAVDAARSLSPPWRGLPGPVLLADDETTVFRAMSFLAEPARSVLVLRWLGIGADDVADEMRLGADAVDRHLQEARAQLHRILDAGGGGR